MFEFYKIGFSCYWSRSAKSSLIRIRVQIDLILINSMNGDWELSSHSPKPDV